MMTFPVSFQLDIWLTAVGYSLCFGTIIAKMCRVYYIFNNPALKKKVIMQSYFCFV